MDGLVMMMNLDMSLSICKDTLGLTVSCHLNMAFKQ